MLIIIEQLNEPDILRCWELFQTRFPRISQMARDILAIQAAGVGIEREFNIARMFDLDNRSYSTKTMSALMICHHAQAEEIREDRINYFISGRVETISPEELIIEKAEAQDDLLDQLQGNYISDDEDDEVDEDISSTNQYYSEESSLEEVQSGKRQRLCR